MTEPTIDPIPKKYVVSEERKREFEQRPGEDPYGYVARQMDMSNPYELAWLYMLRNHVDQPDGTRKTDQAGAMNLMQSAKSVAWTRRAVYAALAIAVLNIPLSLVIALIARGK